MTWSLMLPLLFQFILFKKLESLPSCTSGTICFNASMVPTLPNRATEPSGCWQIHPNPWKNTGGDEWKYIWGQISVRWNLCPNPCFAQVFRSHCLVSLVILVGFLPSPHFDKNLNFPHPVQNRFKMHSVSSHLATNLVSKFHRVSCANKTCSLSGHFSFRTCLGHPLAQMPVPKLSKTQSATIRNHFTCWFIYIWHIFGFPGAHGDLPFDLPLIPAASAVRTNGVCGFFQGHPCICDVGTINIDLMRAAERL